MKLSLIIPTYNEKGNIEQLLFKIQNEFYRNNINGEIIIIDDNSPDGTGDILESLKSQYKNLVIIHRKGKSGLSSAVLEGFTIASGNVWGVMDADLSHSPEKIPEMLNALKGDINFVIGSRYVFGGKIEGWGFYRKTLSKGATILARLFVNVKDPMSGFFMFKKEILDVSLVNSKGFKILLELLVKIKNLNVYEVPIVFINRTQGKSKANLKEIIFYLQNLLDYLPYKRHVVHQFINFALIGLIGVVLNITLFYFVTEYLKIHYLTSSVISFLFASTSNFILNKVLTFKEDLFFKTKERYVKFILISLLSFLVNFTCLYVFTEFLQIYYLISQILAIGISFIINYVGNTVWTFQK